MTYHYRDAAGLVASIEKWLIERVREAGASGGIVGLSGGIDSAVVAALLKRAFGQSMLAVSLPCGSSKSDSDDAVLTAKALDLPFVEIDLTPVYNSFLNAVGDTLSPIAAANIKPRLRMTTLYALAQNRSFLVCGTDNKAERMIGYFTKHGDGGCDLLPIGDLLKREVRILAEHLGIPDRVIVKAPSAGLWEGQTDEEEMGLNYEQIDAYFSSGEVEEEAAARISRMVSSSEHKRTLPPVCIP